MNIELKLPYIQLGSQIYLSLNKAKQYSTMNGEKVYIYK